MTATATPLAPKAKGRIRKPTAALVDEVAFRNALRIVVRSTARRSPYPDFSAVELAMRTDWLRLRAHNGYGSSEVTIPANGARSDLSVLIEGDLVRKLIRVIDPGPLAISCDRARVQVGPYALRCIDEPMSDGDFADVEDMAVAHVDRAAFARAVDFALLAVANDEARPVLTAVHIADDEMVTADNYQIHLVSLGFRTGRTMNVYGRALELIRKALPPTDVVTISHSARGLVLWDTAPNGVTTVVRAGVLDGTYPDYRQVTDPITGPTWQADAAQMLAAVRRAELLVEPVAGVNLAPSLGSVTLSADDGDVGYTILVPASPAPSHITDVNARLLIRALLGAKGQVTFRQEHRLAPLGITREDGFRAAVMPIRKAP